MHSCDTQPRTGRARVLPMCTLVLCLVSLGLVGDVFAQSGSLVNPTVSQRPGPASKGGASTDVQVQTGPTRPSRPVP